MTLSAADHLMDRVKAGERLSPVDITQLAASPDILLLGMLADAVRQRVHGARVTYLRVAADTFDRSLADGVPPAAREVRITGSPDTLDVAVTAVKHAKFVAGDRTVSGFSWNDIERLAMIHEIPISKVLGRLRANGLDTLAALPIDRSGQLSEVLDQLVSVGYRQVRLTVEKAPAAERTGLLLDAAALQDRYACVQAINPLPTSVNALRQTSGYEDVKMVAIARLAAPNVPTIQVDWLHYGPKLAQVALTFGADDLDGVTASDDAPEGRRRAPLEEVRRNIKAAGFAPAERDGRFNVVA